MKSYPKILVRIESLRDRRKKYKSYTLIFEKIEWNLTMFNIKHIYEYTCINEMSSIHSWCKTIKLIAIYYTMLVRTISDGLNKPLYMNLRKDIYKSKIKYTSGIMWSSAPFSCGSIIIFSRDGNPKPNPGCKIRRFFINYQYSGIRNFSAGFGFRTRIPIFSRHKYLNFKIFITCKN